MKISKLFHWLYACLMLLPIFAIGVTCLYTIFNDNAYLSYNGSYQYLNTVKYSDYIENKPIANGTYTLNNTNYYTYASTQFNNYSYDDVVNSTTRDTWIGANCDSITVNNIEYSNIKSFIFGNQAANNIVYCYDVLLTEDYFFASGILYYLDISTEISPIFSSTAIYSGTMSIDVYLSNNKIYTNKLVSSNVKLQKSYFNMYLSDSTLSSAFYNSVSIVNNAPLFAWASDSFLNEPISYITSIFGCPNDSPIITMLSYWLNISIIWLCFDLVMYVPLLCHRWIDKGVKE